MRFDVNVVKRYAEMKGQQVMTAFESIGRVFGGGKRTGAIASITAVGAPVVGAFISNEICKNKQNEKERLYQKRILKQDAEIRILNKKKEDCYKYIDFRLTYRSEEL